MLQERRWPGMWEGEWIHRSGKFEEIGCISMAAYEVCV